MLPFFGKPYTIDDPLFLYSAGQALKTPLTPYATAVAWSGDKTQNLSIILANGPVMSYFLVPTVLAGFAEPVAHLTQFLLLAFALVATAALSLRLSGDLNAARLSALLVATFPAVLGMAGSVMPDIAAMAFSAIALERFLAWRDHDRIRDAVLCAVALGLAASSRSPAILLAGPMAAVALWTGPRRLRALAPLVGGAILFWLGNLLTREPEFAQSSLSSALSMTLTYVLERNVASYFVHWVYAVPVVLYLWITESSRWLRAALFLAPVMLLLRPDKLVGITAIASVVVLASLAVSTLRNRDPRYALLLLSLLPGLAAAPYIHLPSKYLLVSAPAAAVLAAHRLIGLRSAWSRTAALAVAVVSVVLGVAILQADRQMNETARDTVAYWITPEVRQGRRVWIAGHWGFQWYGERAGATSFTHNSGLPQPGDFFVQSRMDQCSLVDELRHKTLLASTVTTTPGGRIMTHPAGFYSTHWGPLPWVWSSSPAYRFELWRIDPPALRRLVMTLPDLRQ